MAYCTLDEAWGPNYTSFLSPASLSPDWLKSKERSASPPRSAPRGYSKGHNQNDDNGIVEGFTGTCGSSQEQRQQKTDQRDDDLLLDYDEFNVPMYYDSPTPKDDSLGEYYKLVNSQSTLASVPSQIEQFDGGYAEEEQYNSEFTRQCSDLFSSKAHRHLKKCRRCRNQLRELLNDIDGTVDTVVTKVQDNVIEPAKSGIKQLFPAHIRGYIDLVFFIAIGVFLIFVLDSFVRLGKTFAKRSRLSIQ